MMKIRKFISNLWFTGKAHKLHKEARANRIGLDRMTKNEALKKLLSFAKKNSPWYKQLLKNTSIDSIKENNLFNLPTINKKTLMEYWDDIVTIPTLNLNKVINHLYKMRETEELLPLDNKYLIFSTGGSSGQKGIFIYDYLQFKQVAVINSVKMLNFYRKYLVIDHSNKLRTAQVVVNNPASVMHAMAKIYTPDYEEKFYFPITRPISDIINGLNETKPHRLIALPSTIYLLCQKALTGELQISPKFIYVAAEPLYEEVRQLIYLIWPDSYLYNKYGATEGLSSISCTPNSHKIHLNDKYSILYPVNNKNKIVEPNQYTDKLIFTNLNSYLLPLINYEIEDRIRFLSNHCPCGSTFPLIEPPQGRPEQNFIYPNNIVVHHRVFVTPLFTNGNIVEFQVYQTTNGANIKVVANGSYKKQKIINSINKSYKNLGIPEAIIKLIEVKNIEHLNSGKIRRFIPL